MLTHRVILVQILLFLLTSFCLGQGLDARDVPGCTPSTTSAPAWAAGVSYTPPELVYYNDILYECVQAHTSSPQWTPPATPDLWQTPTPCRTTAWQTQTIYQIGSMVIYNGAIYTCIQAHTSEVTWTPDSTPALWQLTSGTPSNGNTSTTCISSDDNGIFEEHLKIVEFGNSTAVNITIYIDQVIQPTDNTSEAFGGAFLSLEIFLGSNELYTHHTEIYANGSVHATIHWGPIVHGATLATFDIFNNTITGNIDNRTFDPFSISQNVSTVMFTDGGPSPMLTAPAGLNATLQLFPNLVDRVSRALTSCISSAVPSGNSTQSMVRRGLDRSQDPGHFSATYSSGACEGCKIAAVAAIAASEVACDASTCWWSFGLGCVACTAAAAIAVPGAIEGCEASSLCCPINCGSGFPPTCCFGGEICLDHNGHCCSSDQQACVGTTCCNSDQSCISTGIMKGTCCPDGPAGSSLCGDLCCPNDTDQCVQNSICCAPADVCGSTCCNPIDTTNPGIPNLMAMTCADASIGLCCLYGQTAVNGVCCYPGQVVVDGICCASGNVNCDGECCPGTCQNGQCHYSITDAQCQALGFNGGSCANHLGEWSCGSCDPNGCCLVTPQ